MEDQTTTPEVTETTEPVVVEKTLKQLQAELVELGIPADAAEGFKTRAVALATIETLKASQTVTTEAAPKRVATLEEKVNPVEEKQIARQYQDKADTMRRKLEAQPKVRFFLPISEQEKPGVVREVMRNGRKEQIYVSGAVETVQLNGYKVLIPKGVFVDVPQQVADVLSDAMRLTQNAGANLLIDRIDPQTGAPVSQRLE